MLLARILKEVASGANADPKAVYGRLVDEQSLYGHNAVEQNAVTPAAALLQMELSEGGTGRVTITAVQKKDILDELAIMHIQETQPGV